MGALYDLRPGHIHMGTSISGAMVRIWPTADPDLWHLGCACYPPHATEQPVPSARMLKERRSGGPAGRGRSTRSIPTWRWCARVGLAGDLEALTYRPLFARAQVVARATLPALGRVPARPPGA